MKKHIITLLAVSLITLVGAQAHGRGHGPKTPKTPAVLTDAQKKFDVNADGVLSKEERAAYHAAKKAEILAKYDTDKDGVLSAAEKEVKRDDELKATIAKFDTNGDGALSFAELKAMFAARHNKTVAVPPVVVPPVATPAA